MTIYILKNADPEMGLFFMQKQEEEKYQKLKVLPNSIIGRFSERKWVPMMVKEGTSKSIQNSCIAFYCQKFKGGLFGSCQKYYKTFWEDLSYCM